jgi:hypothetical protein
MILFVIILYDIYHCIIYFTVIELFQFISKYLKLLTIVINKTFLVTFNQLFILFFFILQFMDPVVNGLLKLLKFGVRLNKHLDVKIQKIG